MENLLADLNPSQRDAVAYNAGPHLVIAGAGSGKTRVLTYKIAYLLEAGTRASRILALTFTNKAAREMKERIGHLVGTETARYLWMGTFHSICAKILRQEAEKLGFTRDFSIYDTQDSKSLIKSILRDKGLGGKDDKIYKDGAVLSKISAAKNSLILPDQYALDREIDKQNRIERMYEMADIYHQYQLRLRAANAMDFDDLLVNMVLLLQHDSETLAYYQRMFEYVLVDEYQDTNYTQFLLVKLLAAPDNRVCVVGDDAQSIYSFRGADIRNILSFQKTYPGAQLFKLEQNYRSTQTIVNAANSLIHHNENQIFKNVYSENAVGDSLALRIYLSDREEAEGVTRLVAEEYRQRHTGLDKIAILYRTNSQSRAFENELRRLGLPYRIYGGTSFYQRKEIKDALAYFRIAANSRDNEALTRAIAVPSGRGIGDTTLKKVSDQAILMHLSMYEVLAHPMESGLSVATRTASLLMAFAALIDELRDAMDHLDAYDFATLALTRSGLLSAALADRSPEGIDRKENLDELLSGIHDFVEQRRTQGIDFTPIQDFLAEVALLTDQDEHTDDRTERVTLMTVHAAKGLEFPVVFVVGLEENLFPSQYCTRPSEIEEERRLLYVAITRAMERCYLSAARQRFKNGSVNFASPSRFLKDIDRSFLRQFDTFQSPFGAAKNSTTSAGPRYAFAQTSAPTRYTPVSTASAASTAVSADFAAGDRVSHRVFGNGSVQRIYHENDHDKVDILFDTVGKKTLLLTYAKLEKIL